MERVLLLPLLLLLLLGLGPGHAPRPTLARNCTVADTISVKKGENVPISSTEVSSNSGQLQGEDLFVRPGSDFEAVSLDVQGSDGTVHTAWFSADEECFPRDGKWLLFIAVAEMDSDGFRVGFRSDDCLVMCSLDLAQRRPGNLTVVAHGHSDWSKENPPSLDCVVMLRSSSNGNGTLSICQEPPTTTTTTTTSETPCARKLSRKTIIAIAATVAAVVVVVAVALVVAVYFKKL